MDNESNNQGLDEHTGFSAIDRPLDWLLKDHDMVRKLAVAYRNTQDKAVKNQAAKQMLQLLHNHSRLEESVFYQWVRQVDPPMIGHFEDEHLMVDNLVATLQGMVLDGEHAGRLVLELIDMSLRHIEQEEREFFPKLDQANMDLAPIGLEWQASEANLIHLQAEVSTGARR
jgi:hemerythrin superfamily protein